METTKDIKIFDWGWSEVPELYVAIKINKLIFRDANYLSVPREKGTHGWLEFE